MEEKAVNQELKDQQLEQAAGGSHECGVYTTEVRFYNKCWGQAMSLAP